MIVNKDEIKNGEKTSEIQRIEMKRKPDLDCCE